MIFGTILIYALVAGAVSWLVEYLCIRFGAPGWLTQILSNATLVYVAWCLVANGPIQIGQ